MGDTCTIFELPGTPQGIQLWGIRLKRLLLPLEAGVLVAGESGLSLRLERVGRGGGELVAKNLTFVSSAFGFIVDGHNTAIYEQVNFQTGTEPAILLAET